MNRYKYIDDIKNGRPQHLHTLDGKPLIGTSSVGGVIDKHLEWWAAEMAAVACLESGEHIPTIREEYQAAVANFGPEKKKAIDALCKKYPAFKKARFAHYERKNDAADTGMDMHAELEDYIKGCIDFHEAKPAIYLDAEYKHNSVKIFAEWANENVKKFLWSEIYAYSEKCWTGGICDAGAEMKDGQIAIIDFKSSKEAYPSQFWQVAGYDIELSENGGFDKEGNKVFELPAKVGLHIVFPFGAEKPTGILSYDVEGGREAFEAELLLYKKLNQNT